MIKPRERLSPFGLVLLLGAGVSAGLATTFQDDSASHERLAGEPASELTVAYLTARLHIRPDSREHLILLGEQYLKLDRRQQALNLAQRMEQLDPGDAGLQREALYLRIGVARQEAYQYPPTDQRRAPLMAQYQDTLAKAAGHDWPLFRIKELAQQAQQAGAHAPLLHFYRQLAERDADNQAYWHGLSAETAFAHQQYEDAARSFFQAASLSSEPVHKRDYFLQALRVLESGDRAGLACDLAPQHLAGLEQDIDVLRYLLNLARMANRRELVRRYARQLAQLLELSDAGSPVTPAPPQSATDVAARLLASLLLPQAAMASEQQHSQPAGKAGNEDYDLLYQVYLENGQLAEASDMAQKALAAGLDPLIWDPRLAVAAEWGGNPTLALQAWSRQATRLNSADAWGQVRRLSSALYDDRLYLQALIFEALNAPHKPGLYDQLVQAYERLGEPEAGLQFLEGRPGYARNTELLRSYALLAERSGHDQKAEQAYLQLAGIDPAARLEHVTDAARVKYKQGEDDEALALLREHAPMADSSAQSAVFWRLYAELARLLQSSEDAALAYRNLLATGKASQEDLAAMAYFFVYSPMDAARVAELHLQQGGYDQAMINSALLNYAELRAWTRIHQIIAGMTVSQRNSFEQSATALLLRARYQLYRRQSSQALEDFRHAVQAAPQNHDIRIAYLWALSEYGTDSELSKTVHQWRRLARSNSAYWEVFAAAELRLGNARRAVQLMRKQDLEARRDPLWTITLADAEQLRGNQDLALGLYRQAWRDLHERLAAQQTDDGLSPLPEEIQLAWWQARSGLSARMASGDQPGRRFAELVALDAQLAAAPGRLTSVLGDVSGLTGTRDVVEQLAPIDPLSTGTLYTAIGLSLEQQAYDRARIQLGAPQLEGLPASTDLQMSLALAEHDSTSAAQLLDQEHGRISFYNRLAALGITGRRSEQASGVFAAHYGSPDNDAIHTDLVDAVWPDHSAAGIDLQSRHSEALATDEIDLFARLKLTNRYGITARSITRLQSVRDRSQIARVPATDQETELSLHGRTPDQDVTLTIGQRSGHGSFMTGRLQASINQRGSWTPSAILGWRQYTSASPYLQVAGYKNMLDLGLSWQPRESRWFADLNIEQADYYSHRHDRIGTGTEFNQQLGYRISTSYPDWNVRLIAGQGNYSADNSQRLHPSLARFSPDGQPPSNAQLIPEDFRRYGLMTGFGNSNVTSHARRWRPFADAGYVHYDREGTGPSVSVGLGGPVFGGDHLVLQYQYEATGAGNRQRTNAFRIAYYFNF